MWKGHLILVLATVFSVTQEAEIMTFKPATSAEEAVSPTQHQNGLTSTQSKPEDVTQTPTDATLPDSSNSTTLAAEILQPVLVNQIVPPAKPKPDLAEEHETIKPMILPSAQTLPQDLVDRFPELTTLNKRIWTPNVGNGKEREATTISNYVKPITILSYKPSTSFYHPRPVTLGQIVPSGTPWPASADKYNTTTGSSPQTTVRPGVVTRKTTTTKRPNSKKTKFPVYVSTKTTQSDDIKTSTEQGVKPVTVLEYQPTTTFFLPNPATLPQIIPAGNPWPASLAEYTTMNVQPSATTSPPNKDDEHTTPYVEAQTVLEYKPSTSFYHPRPVTLGQLIPPGKPLPASPEENKPKPPTTKKPSLTVADFSTKSTTIKTPTWKPTVSPVGPTPTSTRIILTYKPSRPWHHQKPGNVLGQIIPPGKPWPSSPAGYPSFSVTTLPPWLKDSIPKDEGDNNLSASDFKPDELQSLKEDPRLEPNALQYYGPIITARPTYNIAQTPFTSGTQKTTISDIVDILQEVHNITLISGNAPPNPSHLLPFDVDGSSQIGSSSIQRPPAKERRPQLQQPIKVYDGALNFEGPQNRERVFANPKFRQVQ